jgi:radical SAM-linked protein
MKRPTHEVPPVPAAAGGEARQRWRLVVRRDAGAPPLPQRDLLAAWEAAVRQSELPVAVSGGRLRIGFGAPLAVGMPAERELVDLFLTRRAAAHHVRDRLADVLPAGHQLVDLFDVWLGAPALQGLVRAAVYRAELRPAVATIPDAPVAPALPDPERIAAACNRLLAAAELRRMRAKAGGTVAYDLRPLLAGLQLRDPGPPPVLEIRTRFDPERGTGRPDEVLAALWQELDISAGSVPDAVLTRERLLLDGEA